MPNPYKIKIKEILKNIDEFPDKAPTLRRELMRIVDKYRKAKKLDINQKYRVYFDVVNNKFALEVYEKMKKTSYYSTIEGVKAKLDHLMEMDKGNQILN